MVPEANGFVIARLGIFGIGASVWATIGMGLTCFLA